MSKEELDNRKADDYLNGRFLSNAPIKFEKDINKLVLFQKRSQIIGLGILIDVEKNIDGYVGEHKFKSIQAIEPSLTIDNIQSVWGDVETFGRTKRKLDISKFPDFLDLIKCRVKSIKNLIEK